MTFSPCKTLNRLQKVMCSGDPKTDTFKAGHFECWTSNGLVLEVSGLKP